jgi:hypothetical protein
MGRERKFITDEKFNPDKMERILQSIVRRVNKTAAVYVPPIPISFGYVSLPVESEQQLVLRCVLPKGKITSLVYDAAVESGTKAKVQVELKGSMKSSREFDVKVGFREEKIEVTLTETTIVTVYTSQRFTDFTAAIMFEPEVSESKMKSVALNDILAEI